MIVSRDSLNAVMISRADDKIPILDNLHINEDGYVVGCNGRAVIAIEPVSDDKMSELGDVLEGSLMKKPVTIKSSSIRKVLKNIERDKTFNGLLDHYDVNEKGVVQYSDGVDLYEEKTELWDQAYIPYTDIIYRFNEGEVEGALTINRKRLISLLTAMDKACPDSGGLADIGVVFIKTGQGSALTMTTENMKTGQKCLGIIETDRKGGKVNDYVQSDDHSMDTELDHSGNMASDRQIRSKRRRAAKIKRGSR